MKKLILSLILALSALVTVQAQERYPQDRAYPQERYYNQGRVVKQEYRYVRYNGVVYREVYRSVYKRNGRLVYRTLLRRERVHYDERYNEGYRFNVFLNF